MKGLAIEAVTPGSIADELEVEPGDRLLRVNGRPLRDMIDYSYYTAADENLLLEVDKPDGEAWELEIEREPDESLGLTFAPPIRRAAGINAFSVSSTSSPKVSATRCTSRTRITASHFSTATTSHWPT